MSAEEIFVATVFFGIISAVFGFTLSRIKDVETRIDTRLNEIETTSEHAYDERILEVKTGFNSQLEDLRRGLQGLRTDIGADRNATNENRVKMARDMVTRDDLKEGLDRLVQEMDRRFPPYRRLSDHQTPGDHR